MSLVQLEPHVDRAALQRELQEKLEGEVRFDEVSRALYSTDASVYLIKPLGVAIPKTREDIIRIVDICRRHKCPELTLEFLITQLIGIQVEDVEEGLGRKKEELAQRGRIKSGREDRASLVQDSLRLLRGSECLSPLLIEPSFLLLDEPFSGIDPIQVLELQKIIFDLKNSGIGILMTDHNVRETLAVTDRAYIINNGRIFRSGTPESLGNDAEVRRVYLGENFSMDLQNGRLQVPASES